MAGAESGWGEGAEAMGRQVWEAWGEALRKAATAPLETAAPAWQQVPGGWPGWTPPQGGGPGEVMERFDGLARHWFGRMQNVASQFADRDNTPADIATAWRQAMGATEAKPYPDLFGSLFGQGATGLDGFSEQWMPWLESLRGPLQDWAQTPAFGPAREHQQRWKALLQAQQALRDANESYQRLLEEASRQAYALFEDKLGIRVGEGAPLDSARALFDEWIDAAEDAYAKMALSEEFREVYGALANAQMRMRAGVQREIEQLGGMIGLPSRTEVDAAHRKIAELERTLRKLMRAAGAAASVSSAQASSSASAHKPATKPAQASASKTAAKKTASKKASAATKPAKSEPKKKAATAKAAPAASKARKPKVSTKSAVAGKPLQKASKSSKSTVAKPATRRTQAKRSA
ncbi:poly(R)-hydroxyalkanoic acid synthase, class III, PhaE subunit [Pseudoxanthomonas sp. GM95]|uniref:poly(R)-hydroxyalkanoic acid synthase subunit PhaE n=1 Tax=Pseudoxanthomonas sp. GM95 TaxID=1881043 RepID=UPI0008BC7728|nr:poly(R)-hydroxyalkanoic acid synthase subunit PhaE [Pseudoxanthomonas sp. GM95]SEK90981.1 poly(R)-hydroxyalkanoic acid synthase, class III, PhaE subunit [Pseudoxanthomonas sp. GM95]